MAVSFRLVSGNLSSRCSPSLLFSFPSLLQLFPVQGCLERPHRNPKCFSSGSAYVLCSRLKLQICLVEDPAVWSLQI